MTGYLAAAGMMAALLRRAEEGGSHHVKLSRARSAMWVQALGVRIYGKWDESRRRPALGATCKSKPSFSPLSTG